uniref:TlpA family protein disulfide reductase n=1 Tax=Flavobacterium sp. TaxID=239 RepID=UPI0040480B43
MINKYLFIFKIIIFSTSLSAQTISGNLNQELKKEIKLEGFDGLKTYLISSSLSDEKGNFKLSYNKSDFGIGYLIASDNKPFFIILDGEDIEIKGETLSYFESIKVTKGKQNQWFEQFSKEQPRREQALSAWGYLDKIYLSDDIFSIQSKPKKAIKDEKYRIKNEEKKFINSLPKESYVKYYLPIRKLVSTVSSIAQYRTEEIPETIETFRCLDYADQRLYKSGLLKDAIESHFWLIENSGKPLDIVYEEMKKSIDAMLSKLVTNEKIFNEVTDYLFDLLERHSLFNASEYLALKVLNEGKCTINTDLANQLETYRAMKKGNIASDIVFDKSNFVNSNNTFTKLSEINAKYTVVVFGASWCPKCNEELPIIAKLYDKWKSNGVEVIFIALEEYYKAFTDFTKSFPFLSYTDLKKWECKIAKDYYVFSTPTMFLLDDKREIILRPNSVNQMDTWVDWFLVKGNKIKSE